MGEHGGGVGGGAMGGYGGRVKGGGSVFVINSYYHSREVRTSTTPHKQRENALKAEVAQLEKVPSRSSTPHPHSQFHSHAHAHTDTLIHTHAHTHTHTHTLLTLTLTIDPVQDVEAVVEVRTSRE
jgi:hypothetical protein